MTSHPHYSWHRTHCIWHHTLYSDIAATESMTRHQLCLWHHTQYLWHFTWCMNDNTSTASASHPLYLCNHTHLIDNITPCVCRKSHPLHIWHQRHCIWHHINSWGHHTIVSMSWHALCLWHHINSICCHTHYVYDNTSSISDLHLILSAITSTVYVMTPTLSKTLHQLCKSLQVEYVCHHMHYTHHIHTVYDITHSIFMTSYPMYMKPPILLSWQHNDYPWYLTHSIWPHLHCICVITPTLLMISQPVYVWYHIRYLCDIWYTVFMTSSSLCMT